MSLNEILIQIVGFVGFGIIGLSYLAKQKSRILLWSLLGGCIVAVHYFLLGGLTGALCNLIGGVALLLIYFYDRYFEKKHRRQKEPKWPLIILVIITSAIIAVLSWAGPESLIAISANTLILFAFVFPKELYIRLANILGGILWLIYGAFMGSISVIICELFIILMTLIGLYKYRPSTKKRKNTPVSAKKKQRS